MKLTDKRFWIFEVSVLLFSVLVTFIIHTFFGSCFRPYMNGRGLMSDFAVPLLSGVLTWLVANGKSRIKFASIFGTIYLILITIMYSAIVLSNSDTSSVETDIYESFGIIVKMVAATGLSAIIPVILLSFIGYTVPKKNDESSNTDYAVHTSKQDSSGKNAGILMFIKVIFRFTASFLVILIFMFTLAFCFDSPNIWTNIELVGADVLVCGSLLWLINRKN